MHPPIREEILHLLNVYLRRKFNRTIPDTIILILFFNKTIER